MAELTPNKRPDGQPQENGELEKSLESLSLDELLASVKDDLARVDAMMNDKDEEKQAEEQAEAELQKLNGNSGGDIKTGDQGIMLFAGLGMAALLGLAVIPAVRRKKI